jgi:hypothetical protein
MQKLVQIDESEAEAEKPRTPSNAFFNVFFSGWSTPNQGCFRVLQKSDNRWANGDWRLQATFRSVKEGDELIVWCHGLELHGDMSPFDDECDETFQGRSCYRTGGRVVWLFALKLLAGVARTFVQSGGCARKR